MAWGEKLSVRFCGNLQTLIIFVDLTLRNNASTVGKFDV